MTCRLTQPAPDHAQNREAGFMLASTTALILVIVAMLSAFVFVIQRDFRFKNHYAAGQRLAAIASHAHLFSQRVFHEGTTVSGALLFDSNDPDASLMAFADQAIFSPVSGVRYEVEIRGWDNSPITDQGTLPDERGVSAYMHIKIRTNAGQILRPTDMTAFMAGASTRGLSRPGVVNFAAASETCDSTGGTVVRWGAEESACLSEARLTELGFVDVQDGDIIIPTWEVALANASTDALFRYKQPQRPELNAMTTNIEMNGIDRDLQDVAQTTTRNLTATDDAEINALTMRDGYQANLAQATTYNSFNVMHDNPPSPTTPSMNVSGTAIFNVSQFSVADTIAVGSPANPVTVNITNPIAVASVSSMGTLLEVEPVDMLSTLTLAAQQSNLPLSSLTIHGNDKHLAVTNTLNIPTTVPLTTAGIYAADMNLMPTATGLSYTSLNVGAVEQIGTSADRYLRLGTVNTNTCTGIACPDFVTDTPGGEL